MIADPAEEPEAAESASRCEYLERFQATAEYAGAAAAQEEERLRLLWA